MSYVVIEPFCDLHDGKHAYTAGDVFPRPGLTASPARCAELAGSGNRRGRPLIVDVDAPCAACAIDSADISPDTDNPAGKAVSGRQRRRKKGE